MSYNEDVLAVLVHDRHRSIADDRSRAPRAGLRRRAAAAGYAVAKAVTVLAVVLDDESSEKAGGRTVGQREAGEHPQQHRAALGQPECVCDRGAHVQAPDRATVD